MRIRVAHVNQRHQKPEALFKYAETAKLAWLTGTTEVDANFVTAADSYGYKAVFNADDPTWLAVRKDLFDEDSWVASIENGMIFAAFESTPPGLGEIVVVSGFEPNLQELSEALGYDLVFSGGFHNDVLGFSSYDAAGQLINTFSRPSNEKHLEAVFTL